MKRRLFTYWEGPKPAYLELCEEIIVKKTTQQFDYVPITPTNVFDFVDRIPKEVHDLKLIAHRSDYIRCLLLLKYGGVWLDLDQVIITDLSLVNTLLNSYDYIGYEWQPECPEIGFIAVSQNNSAMADWKERMDIRLKSTEQLYWPSLGYNLLWPSIQNAIKQSTIRYCGLDPKTTFCPIHHDCRDWFFDTNLNVLDTSSVQSVMLYNSLIPDWFKKLTKEQILASNVLLAHLLKTNL